MTLLAGLSLHISFAYRGSVGDDGSLWLWKTQSTARHVRYAKYAFFIWILSFALLLFPIDAKVFVGINMGVLFLHLGLVGFHRFLV